MKTQNEFRVTTRDGKYTVVLPEDGKLHALRYGEPWRECVGDGLILALAQDVGALRQKVVELEDCKARLYKSFERIARAHGITTPLQLIGMAQDNDENYAEVLARHVEQQQSLKSQTK